MENMDQKKSNSTFSCADGTKVPTGSERTEKELRFVEKMGQFHADQFSKHLEYRFDDREDFEDALNNTHNQQRSSINWLADLPQPHVQIYLKSINAMIDAKIYHTIDLMNKVGFHTFMSCQCSSINDSGHVWIEVKNHEEFAAFLDGLGTLHRKFARGTGAFMFNDFEHLLLLQRLIGSYTMDDEL